MHVHPWPTDQSIAQLVVTDHVHPPARAEVLDHVETARHSATRAIRTGALSSPTADLFASLGFRVIDTLCLLRLDVAGRRFRRERRGASRAVRSGGGRVRRLPRRGLHEAEVVDRAAFGDEWGNTAASLQRIARATPRHRCRQVRTRDGMAAIAISGLGAGNGYLQRLSVLPSHQRRGFGRALVLDSLVWMQTSGARTALVNTGSDNEAALALYVSLGFRVDTEPLRVMELRLDA